MHDYSIDPAVFAAVLGDTAATAAVHHISLSIAELCEVPEALEPATPTDLWNRFYRASLETEGLTSEIDFETRHIPAPESLDDFFVANQTPASLLGTPFHLVVTENYPSRQQACSQVPKCSGWWRFSRVGYSRDQSQALLHIDYDDPRFAHMGMGHFVLLTRKRDVWDVTAKHLTWIS